MQKLGVNENKQTKYTKKLMKEISIGKYIEARDKLLQIKYLLVVILELNSISEVQYMDMVLSGIIDVVKSEV